MLVEYALDGSEWLTDLLKWSIGAIPTRATYFSGYLIHKPSNILNVAKVKSVNFTLWSEGNKHSTIKFSFDQICSSIY